jgi:Tfp pilus assembly protein PilN
MKAVNLIPAEHRKGGGAGAAGRSGGGAHILLGALALVVVLVGAWTVTGRSVTDKEAELARVTREAEAVEAKAGQMASYTKFNDLRNKRVQTVTQLATSRFDWAHALREVARVLPENAWLTSLTGTVAPGVSIVGGGGGNPLRSALSVPAIEVVGCTTSQSSVAKMMARMRLIDGVQRVSLAAAEKTEGETQGSGQAATTGGGGSASDCRNGSAKFPKFQMVVFYRAAAAAPAAGATTAAGAAGSPSTAASTTSAAGTATTPQSSTTPSATTPSTTTPSTTTTASGAPK